MSDFVHLHNHSEFSLLDGLSKIPHLVQKAKDLGMRAVALTDHGSMYGIHKFYIAAKNAGIKPILGCELYLARKTRFDRDPQKDKYRYHQLVLAKDDIGYHNLMKIVSYANLEGFYYKARADWDLLVKYREGLIVTSGCPQGVIPQAIIKQDMQSAEEWTKKYIEVFGDDFYFELQKHDNVGICDVVNTGVLTLSRKYGVPIVATNDVHYVEKEDAEAQDALVAISTKKLISDTNRMSMYNSQTYYLRPADEMLSLFSEAPDACKNTLAISEKCNVEIPLGGRIMPIFPIPGGIHENVYLRTHTHEKAKLRFPNEYPQMKERLDYELDIIINKGYAAYFLIYEDFVTWSKNNKVRVGPGRGSAAGSLVSFCLDITSINPIVHGLPFERFLNPFRPSPPDIDMDFADDRRSLVIDYVRHKYGDDKVAQMITFGKMEARAALRDIGRVLGFPYSDPDRLAKLIPTGSSISDALDNVPEFKAEYEQPQLKKLIDLAQKVEGNVRHASIHAAAVIVSPKPFWEYSPMQKDEKSNNMVTQYDMYDIDCNVSEDAIGLLKMDFLGLRNLSILQKAIDLVKVERNIQVVLEDLPLDDSKVFELFSKGETTGVFQMESAGMRRVARNLKPSKFSDIAALVALYRPGPMELIDDFIAGKENPDKIKYPHPDLKPVLEETYGIAVYQEQALEIAHVMAGYSLGEADILRRAIGKKKIKIMKQEKSKFFDGAKKKGYSKDIAETVWGYIEKFAGYGFNKSHSASYGMIAYQTAFMKVHYPVEYMTALLTAESGNSEKITIAIDECKHMGIKVRPPSINDSDVDFSIEKSDVSLNKQAIRFGLSAIKNVGEAAIESVTTTLKSDGKFQSLSDFFTRVDNQKVNKRVIESLIQVGALDAFGKRSALFAGYEQIRSQAMQAAIRKASGQMSFFDDDNEGNNKDDKFKQDELPDMPEMDKKEMLQLEKQLLGFYLSENPYAKHLSLMSKVVSCRLSEIEPENYAGRNVTVGGIFTSIRQVITKKNNSEMAFATLNDGTNDLDVVIFPKIYAETKKFLNTDAPILLRGRLEYREDNMSLLAEEIREFNIHDADYLQKEEVIEIKIPKGTDKGILLKISNLLKTNLGADKVVILMANGGDEPKRINLPYKINYTVKLKQQLDKLLS